MDVKIFGGTFYTITQGKYIYNLSRPQICTQNDQNIYYSGNPIIKFQ